MSFWVHPLLLAIPQESSALNLQLCRASWLILALTTAKQIKLTHALSIDDQRFYILFRLQSIIDMNTAHQVLVATERPHSSLSSHGASSCDKLWIVILSNGVHFGNPHVTVLLSFGGGLLIG